MLVLKSGYLNRSFWKFFIFPKEKKKTQFPSQKPKKKTCIGITLLEKLFIVEKLTN